MGGTMMQNPLEEIEAGTALPEPGLPGITVIIPAWQPDRRLTRLVDDLQLAGIANLVVVDDGSSPDRDLVFRELVMRPGVAICRHSRNQGKGSALKTAFGHVLAVTPGVRGVVTADADGQHLSEDVLRVARQLAGVPGRAVLGVRSFTGQVPLRSRWGNALTRQVFALLTGSRVRDTQTGLRGLPVSMLPELMALPGERYEYEMVMLAHLCQAETGPVEVPIQTVYLEENRGSHFDPLRDSVRVYRALFQACRKRTRGGSHRVRQADKPRLHAA